MAKEIMTGMRLTKHPSFGIEVLRVHYSADPAKDAAWVAQRRPTVSPAAWDIEFEIDAYAKSGALLYPEFTHEFSVQAPFVIPHDWTRYMAIDPHPRVPHAMLWMAVSPWDDHVYYAEYWPSRAYGRRGNVPEDDEIYHIDEYVEAIQLLESRDRDHFSPNGGRNNDNKDEYISLRIMDTAGKAWETQRDQGKPGEETMWDRYSALGISCDTPKKDFQAGRDRVGQRLRPRRVSDGVEEKMQSQIIIFDTLLELQLELVTVRYPTLTPQQTEKSDPASSPLKKRAHMCDLVRYTEMAEPRFIDRTMREPQRKYLYEGIPY